MSRHVRRAAVFVCGPSTLHVRHTTHAMTRWLTLRSGREERRPSWAPQIGLRAGLTHNSLSPQRLVALRVECLRKSWWAERPPSRPCFLERNRKAAAIGPRRAEDAGGIAERLELGASRREIIPVEDIADPQLAADRRSQGILPIQ